MAPSCIFRFALSAAAVFLVATVHIQHADAQWTYRVATDPYIRNVVAVANTPSVGTHTLFVGTLTDGVYKVTDTGNQSTVWQKINNGLPVLQVRTLTFIDINTLYAGTDGAGLFKTADANAGATWTALNGGGASALGCANIRSINFDATMPRTLIVGTACRNNSGYTKARTMGLTGPGWGIPPCRMMWPFQHCCVMWPRIPISSPPTTMAFSKAPMPARPGPPQIPTLAPRM